MRRITKGTPPPSLIAHAKERVPDPAYGNYPDTDGLRSCLVRDQGGLCCYCMRRIWADGARMKIEHLRSQRRHPRLQLDWKNLFGACNGGEGARRSQQTCDTRKGDADIDIELLALRDDTFRYTEAGRIESTDGAKQADIDATLNLNEAALVRARISAVSELRRRLQQKLGATGTWTPAALGRERAALCAKRPLPELLGLLEYWIARHQRGR
jgi:uncharacterized protein (TIGR02646 family)